MRIRTVKPEFWRHAVMAQLPAETQLLALALLNMADDEGYFEADSRIVRGEVMPFRDDLATVSRDLRELVRVGWIEVRETSGHGHVGLVVTWDKHQRVDHPKDSKLSVYFNASDSRAAFAPSSREPRDASREEQGTGNREVEQGAFSGVPPDPVAKSSKKPKADKPTDPRHAPLVATLVAAFRAVRGADYGFTGRDAKHVTELLALGEPADVEARWRRALAHVGFPAVATLSDLVTHWNRFAGAAPTDTRSPVAAESVDWTRITPGEVSL